MLYLKIPPLLERYFYTKNQKGQEIMRKTLIKTLNLENGKLYGEIDGSRICMAECEPTVEIYEHNTTVPFIGNVS